MKLRLDLLDVMTPGDVLEEARRNQHRYSAEPIFSKTGIGSLSPTPIEDQAKEAQHGAAVVRKLKRRSAKLKRHSAFNRPMSPEELRKRAHRLAGNKSRAESAKLAAQITEGFYAGS